MQLEIEIPEHAHRGKAGRTAKRTERQRFLIRHGYHPLSPVVPGRTLPLYPTASRMPHRRLKGLDAGPKCGNCKFLTRLFEQVDVPGREFKCGYDNGRRVTCGSATDVRLWWPACRDYASDAGEATGRVSEVPGRPDGLPSHRA